MSQRKSAKKTSPQPASKPPNKWIGPISLILLLTLAIYAGLRWLPRGSQPVQPSTASPLASAPTNSVPVTAEVKPELQALKGKWLRTEDNYVLEISAVDADGKLEAAYYNPRTIHVSQARALRETAGTKVFIELQDIGYPGSTYNLVHDRQDDKLKGIYFQAALQENFEVVFERIK